MRYIAAVIILIAALALLISLASCGASKKSRSSSRSSVDSSVTTSKVSEGKSQESTVTDRSKDSSYGSELDIEFDNDAQSRANELAGPQDTGKPSRITLTPVTDPGKGKLHKVKVNGKTIESTVPIKRATLRENGQVRQLDITNINRADSGRQEEKAIVQVKKKDEVKERRSFSWKIPWWVYLLIIGGGITAWRYGWFKAQKYPFTVKYKPNGKSKTTDQT